MNWLQTLIILLLFASTLTSITVAAFSWQRRPTVWVRPFVLLMLTVAVWTLAKALEVSSSIFPIKLFWFNVQYLGITIAPIMFLAFARAYYNQTNWQPRRYLPLFILPLVTLWLVWTGVGGLMSATLHPDTSLLADLQVDRKAWFWIHSTYSYLVTFVATLLLGQVWLRSHLHRLQTGIILLGGIVPWMGITLFIFDLSLIDWTPVAFSLTGILIGWGLFRLHLFDVVPMAQRAIIDQMRDGVFVLDQQNRIIDLNAAAETILNQPAHAVIGRPIDHIHPEIDWSATTQIEDEVQKEVIFAHNLPPQTYELRLSPLYTRQVVNGRLLILHNITERKQTEQQLLAQKRLFQNLVIIARATTTSNSLQATLQSILDIAVSLNQAEYGSLFTVNNLGEITHSILAQDQTISQQKQRIFNQKVMEKGLFGWVLRHGQMALIHDTEQDDRWLHLPQRTQKARSALATPITDKQGVVGVLTLTHSQVGHFSEEQATLMQGAADQMALALRNAQLYDKQRRLAKRQNTLYEVLWAVGEHLDAKLIARTAVDAISYYTSWPALSVSIVDDPATHLIVEAASGLLAITEGSRITTNQGINGRAFITGQTQVISQAQQDDPTTALPGSSIAIPLCQGDKMLGVFTIQSDQPTAFDTEDVQLAESLAEAISLALDNARLHSNIRHYAANLDTLYKVTRALSGSLNLDEVLVKTLDTILASLHYDAGFIALLEPGDNALHHVIKGLMPYQANHTEQLALMNQLAAYTHDRNEPIIVSDLEQDTSLNQTFSEIHTTLQKLGMAAYTGIPLLHQERPVGVLCLFARQPRDPTNRQVSLQLSIGRQIGTALTNAQLFQAVATERGRFQSLIESSRDGIIFISLDKTILLINETVLSLLGITIPAATWINQPIHQLLDRIICQTVPAVASEQEQEMDLTTLTAEIDYIETGEEPATKGEIVLPPRTLQWFSSPVLTEAHISGRLLIFRDVTEERLLERMRDDLIHMTVHDLRNPLSAQSMALELLHDEKTPNREQLFHILKTNNQRMLNLVNNILDISRLENRQMPLEYNYIIPADLVAEAFAHQNSLAQEKNILLESDLPAGLPLAWVDYNLIERVLQNLIGNAIKFTPPHGRIKVTICVDPDLANQWFRISVYNTGECIPPDIQEHLFQKFTTGRQRERGSGLGLAFCKMVVEAHGGRIWVDSTPEQGTTFSFTIPCA